MIAVKDMHAARKGPHVVIDGRELVGRPTGVGRYLMGLLTEWASDNEHRITVIVPGDVPSELRALSPAIAVDRHPAQDTGTLFEQLTLPAIVNDLRADVLFSPAYTAPVHLLCPFVVAIHDLSYFAHPEWFRWAEGVRRRSITKRAARKAAGVITISAFSADELTRYLGLRREDIVIAPPGPPVSAPHAPVVSSREPLVLYTGSIFARRGIPDLINAFADVVASLPDAKLVLVGDDRANPPIDPDVVAARAGIAQHVSWRRYVSDDELHGLYEQARVFAFLSEYEGFAMTPMEAIAQGVPVVLRDTPVAREVYADGAALVGHDRAALSSTLLTLLTDEAAHSELLTRGRARLDAFSWKQSADAVMATLLRAASQS